MAYLGREEAPSSFVSIIGDALTKSLGKREEGKLQKRNEQLLEGLGFNKSIASPLSHQSPDNIFKFLSQFEDFNIAGGQPQQQQLQNNPQFQPKQDQSRVQNQPLNQNQPNYPQKQVQNEQADIAGMVKQAYQQHPDLANQISPEQLGQLLQAQAAQQALNPTGQNNQQHTGPKSKAAAAAERSARAQQLKELHELRKIDIKEEQDAKKESKKVLAQLNKDAKTAKENDMKLDRMSELIKTGKLSSPLFHNTLDTVAHGLWGIGIDLHFLESPESQEFTKLSNDMIKGIKDIFGARVTDLDLKSYAKTLPNLSQTNEGKERIIRNLKISNQANKLKESAAKRIIRANGNEVPVDLELLVEEQVNPQLDALAERFVNNTQPLSKKRTAKTEEPIDTLFKGTGLNKLSLLQ